MSTLHLIIIVVLLSGFLWSFALKDPVPAWIFLFAIICGFFLPLAAIGMPMPAGSGRSGEEIAPVPTEVLMNAVAFDMSCVRNCLDLSREMPASISPQRHRTEQRILAWLSDETISHCHDDVPFGCHNALGDLVANGLVEDEPYSLTAAGKRHFGR